MSEKFTTKQLAECAEAEVRMRHLVYGRKVLQGKMPQNKAEREIAMMQQIAQRLRTWPSGLAASVNGRTVIPGDCWRHYKGGTYEVLLIGERESDQSAQVIYQPLIGNRIWIRPIEDFLGTAPNGELRFALVR